MTPPAYLFTVKTCSRHHGYVFYLASTCRVRPGQCEDGQRIWLGPTPLKLSTCDTLLGELLEASETRTIPGKGEGLAIASVGDVHREKAEKGHEGMAVGRDERRDDSIERSERDGLDEIPWGAQ